MIDFSRISYSRRKDAYFHPSAYRVTQVRCCTYYHGIVLHTYWCHIVLYLFSHRPELRARQPLREELLEDARKRLRRPRRSPWLAIGSTCACKKSREEEEHNRSDGMPTQNNDEMLKQQRRAFLRTHVPNVIELSRKTS